jgi:fructose/tagatose bisphosphate aldolase
MDIVSILMDDNFIKSWDDPVFAICPSSIHDKIWLKSLINSSNLKLIISGDMSLDKILTSIMDSHDILVFLDLNSITGTRAKKIIDEKEKVIRKITPNAGILCITNTKLNPRLLPLHTWIINKNTTIEDIENIVGSIQSKKEDNIPLYRKWPKELREKNTFDVSKKSYESILDYKYPMPTFNIKHPSMFVPISVVSERTKKPVFCEISPQEALSYYSSNSYTKMHDYKEMIKKSLSKIKEDFDFIKNRTNSDMKLHLDHCNDPTIILHALDIGFDSIMADGSGYPLHKNIKFTNIASSHARKCHALIEGEVGSIDVKGIRKTSKTNVSDVEQFIASVTVDFLAVNIGQNHGSDYEFDRSRRAIRGLTDLEFIHHDQDNRSLYKACSDIDNILEENGFSIFSKERKMIKNIQDTIISDDVCIFDFITSDKFNMDIPSYYWLVELQHLWTEYKENVYKKKKDLYRKIIGKGIKNTITHKRLIDFDLLSRISNTLKGTSTRIVVHGGSSISYSDLGLLHKYGVSRVNFGKDPFVSFINSILSNSIGSVTNNLYDPVYCTRFMNDNLENWRSWVDYPPFFLEPFQDELESSYFCSLHC